MAEITRRSFLAKTAASLAGAAVSLSATRLRAQTPAGERAVVRLPAEAAGPEMPADFVGLSYEVQQLTDPGFFSAANTGLVRQFRALSRHGVLRLGGNTSEFSWWKPAAGSPEPGHPSVRTVAGEPRPQYYPVTAEAVHNLDRFLRAAGWTCIYGLNLGTSTPERAAEEAAYAARALGPRLKYFQIGNEVDLFGRHLRDPKLWNPQTYLQQWLAFARAVAGAVPEAKLAMPDIAGRLDWLTAIARLWPEVPNPPPVVCLTHHYYFGGPATNPKVNIPNLLSPAAAATVQSQADAATAAARSMGVSLRMTEGNTCYRGGKPGLSDVFAASLWAADYALRLASDGYGGVNLHGGSGPSVANSVGGALPGDEMLRQQGATPEQIASHPHPFYTPIASFGSEYVLEPVGYGLKFAGLMSGGRFLDADLGGRLLATGVNAVGYAARMPGGDLRVAILNKDADRELALDLELPAQPGGGVEGAVLHAPALDSREATISPAKALGRFRQGRYAVTVPRATGLCLTFRG